MSGIQNSGAPYFSRESARAPIPHILVDMADPVQTRIANILHQVSKQPVNVGPDDSLFDSGLLDSFALPDVVSAIEQEFGIRVPDSDLTPRKFESISSIERYIASRT